MKILLIVWAFAQNPEYGVFVLGFFNYYQPLKVSKQIVFMIWFSTKKGPYGQKEVNQQVGTIYLNF